MKVKSESEVTQSCPTLSDPMDCSLPGSSVHGIFQARILEWVAVTFSDCLLEEPANPLGKERTKPIFHAYVLNSVKNYQAFKKQTEENKIIEIDPSQINKNKYFFLKKGLFWWASG